jgi:excisionase family DNA binding protein
VSEHAAGTMTAQQAAEYLGVPLDSLYAYCRRRLLPHIRVGKHVRFRLTALDGWMADQEKASVAPVVVNGMKAVQ